MKEYICKCDSCGEKTTYYLTRNSIDVGRVYVTAYGYLCIECPKCRKSAFSKFYGFGDEK